MSTRQLRLLRGASASSIATALAALSHTFGGGSLPQPLLMLAVAVLLTPVAALLVGRRVRLPGLAAAVAATQVAFHALFELLGGVIPTGAASGAHQHGPMVLAFAPGADPSLLTASPGMLAAHVAAAVVTTALLWRGELLVQAIAGWVRGLLRTHRSVTQHVRQARLSVPRAAARVRSRLLADCAWRRGPPTPAARIVLG